MKTLIIASVLALFFYSCNQHTNDKLPISNDEISDTAFQNLFQASQAKLLKDTTVHYQKIVAQAASNLSSLINVENLSNCTGLPRTIADLIGGTEFNVYKFDKSTSASANLMGFEGNIGKKEMVFIQDYIRFKNVECDGGTKRIGIGLRCFIHVKSIKGKIGAKLSNIAASIELDRAQGTFNLKSLGFGIDGSVLAEGLSTQGDYNVENFGKLAVTFNNVLKLLNGSSTMAIQPVELPLQ